MNNSPLHLTIPTEPQASSIEGAFPAPHSRNSIEENSDLWPPTSETWPTETYSPFLTQCEDYTGQWFLDTMSTSLPTSQSPHLWGRTEHTTTPLESSTKNWDIEEGILTTTPAITVTTPTKLFTTQWNHHRSDWPQQLSIKEASSTDELRSLIFQEVYREHHKFIIQWPLRAPPREGSFRIHDIPIPVDSCIPTRLPEELTSPVHLFHAQLKTFGISYNDDIAQSCIYNEVPQYWAKLVDYYLLYKQYAQHTESGLEGLSSR